MYEWILDYDGTDFLVSQEKNGTPTHGEPTKVNGSPWGVIERASAGQAFGLGAAEIRITPAAQAAMLEWEGE